MIWKFAIVPRTVEVRFAKDGNSLEHDFLSDIPAILHVSVESRKEGLNIYTADLKTEHSLNGMYFNYELDTLYIRQFDRIQWPGSSGLQIARDNQIISFVSALPNRDKIQRLIMASNCIEIPHGSTGGVPVILGFPSLKELAYQIGHYDKEPHDCCNIKLRPNRTSFMSDSQYGHFIWHRHQYVPEHEYVAQFSERMKQIPGILMEKIEKMKADNSQIQWNTPRVKTVAIINGHIRKVGAYCKVDADDSTDHAATVDEDNQETGEFNQNTREGIFYSSRIS